MNIVVGSDGSVKFIAHDQLRGLMAMGEHVNKKRASNVEPVNFALRVVFRSLRSVTGETGKVSDWTRTWKCSWRVNLALSGGPVKQPFFDRAAAIAWEVDWLTENRLGGSS